LKEKLRATKAIRDPTQVIGGVDNDTVSRHSLDTLNPGKWLNDEIINAATTIYSEYMSQKRKTGVGSVPVMKAFSNIFYTKLDQNDYKDAKTGGWDSVKRWANKKKIAGKSFLDCKLVLAPCNVGGNHWTLLAFWPSQRVVEYYDSFDGPEHRPLYLAKKYLTGELGKHFNESEWSFRKGKSPAQTNGYDCGVFVCTTAKMLALGFDPELTYTGANMRSQRERIAAEIINRGLSGELEPVIADQWWELPSDSKLRP
jgi:sentrin-specific protease 1